MSRRSYVHRPGHPKANDLGMVDVADLGDEMGGMEPLPVFTDRYMEGTVSPVDGSDIGSRAKRREHMRAHGLADADDFKGEWARKAEQRASFMRGEDGKPWAARVAETMERMGRKR